MTAVRTLTVSSLHRDQGYVVPYVRLSGLWLQTEAGIEPGDRIRVSITFGQLVITKLTPEGVPVEPGANPEEFGFVRELDQDAQGSSRM